MLGSTASQLAHRAECPLLVARRTVDANHFPQSILLATDGSAGGGRHRLKQAGSP
jgi:hypothetical protein